MTPYSTTINLLEQLRGKKIQKAGEILSRHQNVIWLGDFGDIEPEIKDTLRNFKDTEEIAEGKYSKSDRVLVKSDRLKPLHYINLNEELDDYVEMEVKNGVVCVIQL
eukprot:sb/3477627/